MATSSIFKHFSFDENQSKIFGDALLEYEKNENNENNENNEKIKNQVYLKRLSKPEGLKLKLRN